MVCLSNAISEVTLTNLVEVTNRVEVTKRAVKFDMFCQSGAGVTKRVLLC